MRPVIVALAFGLLWLIGCASAEPPFHHDDSGRMAWHSYRYRQANPPQAYWKGKI